MIKDNSSLVSIESVTGYYKNYIGQEYIFMKKVVIVISRILLYSVSTDIKIHNYKIKTIFVSPEMLKARANKTEF